MSQPMSPFSDAALAKQAAIKAKEARGEKVTWSDLAGAYEPNPNLPDCPCYDTDTGLDCELPNHHEGKHRAEVTW